MSTVLKNQTLNSQAITRETLDGVSYYTTSRRGVDYCACKQKDSDQWWVSTHRSALGPLHIGGGRYYDSLADLAANCKAFAALPALINYL
ncbi:hypothetical protein PTW32_09775 [Dechloromonas agitata]|uniref:hypothetical protein n=1 Tax=Dechloromonas agitata TaxID=73030 RepID=UPI00237E8917|nr:hypothetical protein [Dechloromonas agitata]MDE1545711.1 hypothetical protein [Dechloromonas agitata]